MNIADVVDAEDDDFGEEGEEVLCAELEIVLEEGGESSTVDQRAEDDGAHLLQTASLAALTSALVTVNTPFPSRLRHAHASQSEVRTLLAALASISLALSIHALKTSNSLASSSELHDAESRQHAKAESQSEFRHKQPDIEPLQYVSPIVPQYVSVQLN